MVGGEGFGKYIFCSEKLGKNDGVSYLILNFDFYMRGGDLTVGCNLSWTDHKAVCEPGGAITDKNSVAGFISLPIGT